MKYKLGAIGGGVLGKAIGAYYTDLKIYDKFKPIDTLEVVKNCDIIFICVPTPFSGSFDRSFMDDAFSNLADLKDTIVIIKSTVIPGTTDELQERYPNLRIMFSPEFLTEATAKEDFAKPDKQIIGYTQKSKDIAEEILNILPPAPYKKVMKAKEAELVKYAVNSFYATKVIFGNFLYDIASVIGADYSVVREAFVSDKRITDSHFDVMHGGYRGYGGKCLPKDVLALIELAEKIDVDPLLLKAVHESNILLNGAKK